MSALRTRWAAIGAAVAVTLGAGGIGLVSATEPSDATTRVTITPCRLTDTRPASQVGPRSAPLGPNDTYTVTAHGANGDCDIPATATALSMNVTAVGATADTFLVFWDDGDRPTAANLNPRAGGPPTPNAVSTPLSATGAFDVFNRAGNVHVVIDVNGYDTDHTHDDRYYSQEEVDMLLADDGPLAWGWVETNGDPRLDASSANVVGGLRPETGEYCVIFDPPIPVSRLRAAVVSPAGNNNAFTAENVNFVGGPDGCVDAPDQAGLQVDVFNTGNNTRADGRFSFIVP